MILSLCPNPSKDCYAWLDKFELGGVNRIEGLQEYPGGKGVHVALAIRELGGLSRLFANWSGGAGEWIKDACVKKGLEISGIKLEGNNRKCHTFRSLNPDILNTELLEPGPNMKTENWEEFKTCFKAEMKKVNLICFSGSWPTDAPKDAYLQLINLTEKGKKIFLDCSGTQLKEALKSSFFGLHLNEEEAFKLCGSTDFETLLETLADKVELVALTRGKEGLWMRYKGVTYISNVKIDKVISTVGSGDCLTGGILWALEQNLEPSEIAAYGVACGAANCLNEDLGMFKREDVEKLLPKVNCKIIENEF